MTVYERDRFRFSGQPSRADLERAAAEGVTTVISLRSTAEMDELGFDQAGYVGSLGMSYVHVPMGGDDGYDPAQVALFAEALMAHDGPVYLHCGSGTRARRMWMAHSIESGELTIDEAKAVELEIGGRPAMLEQLLDRKIVYDLAD